MTVEEKLDIIYSFKTYSNLDKENRFLDYQLRNRIENDKKIFDYLFEKDLKKFNKDYSDTLIALIYEESSFEEKINFFSKNEAIYGEIKKIGVETIISHINRNLGQDLSSLNFLDIGSGKGKLCMHILLRTNFRNVIGVELNKSLFDCCDEIQKKSDVFDERLCFLNTDMMNHNFENTDLIFLNNVCFAKETNELLFSKFKNGSNIICAIFPNSDLHRLTLIDKIELDCSWGNHTFHYLIKE